jgi:urease accessory protein
MKYPSSHFNKDNGVIIMQSKCLSMTLLALATLLLCPLALAHTGTGHAAGLADGFMHPATGLDHLLIAIAAGVWAGRSGDHGVPDVAFFMLMLLVGMLLGTASLAYPQLQMSTILVILSTAVFVAMTIVAPQHIAYLFFGGLAVYQGIFHVLEMPALAMVAGYAFGLFFATLLLLLLGLIVRQVVATLKPHSETIK